MDVEDKDKEIIKLQLEDVTLDVLEDSEVSKREFDQLKMMMNLDIDMFRTDQFKIHRSHFKENLYDAFVDFTKLPEDLPKAAKDILFRPAKMKRLSEVYRKLIRTIVTHKARKEEDAFEEE